MDNNTSQGTKLIHSQSNVTNPVTGRDESWRKAMQTWREHENLPTDSNPSSGSNWEPWSSEATTLPAVPLRLKHMKENPFGLMTIHCLLILFIGRPYGA